MKKWLIVLENDYYSKKNVEHIVKKVIGLKDNDFEIKVILK